MAKDIKPKTIFIVGLGNPGKKYYNTPHSAGFAVIDEFAKRFEFPKFKMESDGILISKKEICDGAREIGDIRTRELAATMGNFGSGTVILAKPQMFMNNSGKALSKLFVCQKIKKTKSYSNLWVVNDDLDIPLGKIKIAKNRGSAGHKGVQSIIDQLKTKNFIRFRVGIQTPEITVKKIPADKFVLKKLSLQNQSVFNEAINWAVDSLASALASGIDSAMTKFNK